MKRGENNNFLLNKNKEDGRTEEKDLIFLCLGQKAMKDIECVWKRMRAIIREVDSFLLVLRAS